MSSTAEVNNDESLRTSGGVLEGNADTLEALYELDERRARDENGQLLSPAETSVIPSQRNNAQQEINELKISLAQILEHKNAEKWLRAANKAHHIRNSSIAAYDTAKSIAAHRFYVDDLRYENFNDYFKKLPRNIAAANANIAKDLADETLRHLREVAFDILMGIAMIEDGKDAFLLVKNALFPDEKYLITTNIYDPKTGQMVPYRSKDAMLDAFKDTIKIPKLLSQEQRTQIKSNFSSNFNHLENIIKEQYPHLDEVGRVSLAANIGDTLAKTINGTIQQGSIVTIGDTQYDLLDRNDVTDFINASMPSQYKIKIEDNDVAKHRADTINELFNKSGMDIEEFAQIFGSNNTLTLDDEGKLLVQTQNGKVLLEDSNPDILELMERDALQYSINSHISDISKLDKDDPRKEILDLSWLLKNTEEEITNRNNILQTNNKAGKTSDIDIQRLKIIEERLNKTALHAKLYQALEIGNAYWKLLDKSNVTTVESINPRRVKHIHGTRIPPKPDLLKNRAVHSQKILEKILKENQFLDGNIDKLFFQYNSSDDITVIPFDYTADYEKVSEDISLHKNASLYISTNDGDKILLTDALSFEEFFQLEQIFYQEVKNSTLIEAAEYYHKYDRTLNRFFHHDDETRGDQKKDYPEVDFDYIRENFDATLQSLRDKDTLEDAKNNTQSASSGSSDSSKKDKENIKPLDSKLPTLDSKIPTLDNKLQTLDNKQQQLQQKIDALNNRITTIESSDSEFKTSALQKLQNEKKLLETQLYNAKEEALQIQQQKNTLIEVAEMQTLLAEKYSYKKDITKLREVLETQPLTEQNTATNRLIELTKKYPDQYQEEYKKIEVNEIKNIFQNYEQDNKQIHKLQSKITKLQKVQIDIHSDEVALYQAGNVYTYYKDDTESYDAIKKHTKTLTKLTKHIDRLDHYKEQYFQELKEGYTNKEIAEIKILLNNQDVIDQQIEGLKQSLKQPPIIDDLKDKEKIPPHIINTRRKFASYIQEYLPKLIDKQATEKNRLNELAEQYPDEYQKECDNLEVKKDKNASKNNKIDTDSNTNTPHPLQQKIDALNNSITTTEASDSEFKTSALQSFQNEKKLLETQLEEALQIQQQEDTIIEVAEMQTLLAEQYSDKKGITKLREVLDTQSPKKQNTATNRLSELTKKYPDQYQEEYKKIELNEIKDIFQSYKKDNKQIHKLQKEIAHLQKIQVRKFDHEVGFYDTEIAGKYYAADLLKYYPIKECSKTVKELTNRIGRLDHYKEEYFQQFQEEYRNKEIYEMKILLNNKDVIDMRIEALEKPLENRPIVKYISEYETPPHIIKRQKKAASAIQQYIPKLIARQATEKDRLNELAEQYPDEYQKACDKLAMKEAKKAIKNQKIDIDSNTNTPPSNSKDRQR